MMNSGWNRMAYKDVNNEFFEGLVMLKRTQRTLGVLNGFFNECLVLQPSINHFRKFKERNSLISQY